MIDRLWSRLWLAVFLATVIPLAAFLLLGVVLIQRGAATRRSGRTAQTAGAPPSTSTGEPSVL